MMLYDILINTKGGSFSSLTQERVEELIGHELPGQVRSLHCAEGPSIARHLQAILDSDPEAVLIGGGDGTVSLCGIECMKAGVPFGIIPLGTMNLLARDLKIPLAVDECLRAYRNGMIDSIDSGCVNGQFFFCNAVIGVVPEASIKREEIRETPSLSTWAALAETIVDSMRGEELQVMRVHMRNMKRPLKAKSIIVANNSYSETVTAPQERLSREDLKGGLLTIYTAAPTGFFQSLRLFLRLITGRWQKDPSIHSFQRKEMTLETPERDILVSIDGEPMTLTAPLTFEIRPLSAKVVLPG